MVKLLTVHYTVASNGERDAENPKHDEQLVRKLSKAKSCMFEK